MVKNAGREEPTAAAMPTVPNTTHWGAAGDYTQPLVRYYMAKED